MPKGQFTHCACVLLDQAPSLDELKKLLADFEVRNQIDAGDQWAFAGPTLIIDFQPEQNGFVSVDIVDRPWPDEMGDPQTDAILFGAWTLGHFGPSTFPGGLERAAQQCWAWEPGETMPQRHKAFVRIRTSYVFGGDKNAPVIPPNYDPVGEMEFATRLATAILNAPQALCYFNPNGEILRDKADIQESLNFAAEHGFPALDIWSNVRLFKINDEWALMDTVGNEQLDIPDVEAVFATDNYDPNEIDNFLRNVSLYLHKEGEIINDNDTMDGPGNVPWQAQQLEEATSGPPRRVLRWHPLDGSALPAEVAEKST